MFEKSTNTTEDQNRGQVGIGTLIVFIALVLVAAIAAGVLINTAGFLQSQAEATGEESTSQVSNGVELVSASAEADSSGEISVVELRVGLAPGSDRIDLTEATIGWVGESNSATLSVEEDTSNALTAYTDINTDVAEAPNNAVIPTSGSQDAQLTDESDRATIVLVSANSEGITALASSVDDDLSGDLPISEDEGADVTITVRSGGQTTTTLRAPSIMNSGEGIDL
jgi:flagellin FlaB